MIHLFRKNRLPCLISIFVVSVLSISQVPAQNIANSGIDAIKAAYNRFNYAEVISLSLQSLAATPSPSTQEKIEIYTYLAFARVSLGQNENARKDFEAALQLNPEMTLDPVYVSPKIIALFNEVKQLMQAGVPKEQMRPPAVAAAQYDMRRGAAWRSLLIPGWGQWYKGQKKKAIAILAVQAIQISAFVYTQTKVEQTHDKYLQATDPTDIESAYNKYNSFHKRRSYIALSTAAVWLYAHIDAALTASSAQTVRKGTETVFSLRPSLSRDYIGCTYVVEF